MSFDIGEILSRAWQITSRYRILWVFNMFPVLIGFLFIPVVFIPMFFIGPYALVKQGAVSQPSYLNLFVSTNILLAALSLLLYVVASASSSLGILRIEGGRQYLIFRDLFQDGLEYFWRILGVTLLIGGTTLLGFALVSGCILLVSTVTSGLGLVCLMPVFLFLYPAVLLAYSLIEQSQAAVIADQMGVVSAISRGWALVRAHVWKFVLISLIIYLAIFLLGMIVSLPLVVPFVFIPLLPQAPVQGFNAQGFGWALLCFSLIVLPILALVQGVCMTFLKSAFMIVYLRLTRSTVLQTALQ